MAGGVLFSAQLQDYHLHKHHSLPINVFYQSLHLEGKVATRASIVSDAVDG